MDAGAYPVRPGTVSGHVVAEKYTAAEMIPGGRFVVLRPDGTIVLPCSADALYGVALATPTGRAWEPGERVPVLRTGVVALELHEGKREGLAGKAARLSLRHPGSATNRPGCRKILGVTFIKDPSGAAALARVELSAP